MDFKLTPEQIAWQNEVRQFLIENVTPQLRKEMLERELDVEGPLVKEFRRKMGEKGWGGINWPKEYGGLNKTMVELYIFSEEFNYFGAPFPSAAQLSTGPAIIRFGTEENIKMWIPKISTGEVYTGLGYSEPNAGTDLASLQTTAVLEGDEWVINGQKTWNTNGHNVTHQWLAVRTNPNAPKHKGISVIMVPMDAPGVTVRQIKHWGDHRTNEIFFDNVRVPKNYLIGEVNQGWKIITSALDFERVIIGSVGAQRRVFDEMVKYCKETVIDGELLINKPEVRSRLVELKMELEVGRLFGFRAASMVDQGVKDISKEASMMKVFATELGAKIADWGMQIMEMYGQLNKHDPRAPKNGLIEDYYRKIPFHRFGGGTNEVQRNIVAQRGLGLPRR